MKPPYWPDGGQPWRTEPFTWIKKDVIAASWWPDPPLFERYRNEGIKVIINCSEFDYGNSVPEDFQYHHILIPDYGIPTEDQIHRFLDITTQSIDDNMPIVVHCVAGCGRTGQLLVIWGSYNNEIPDKMDPVKWIRNYRSCSLETKEQMHIARKYAQKFKNKKIENI